MILLKTGDVAVGRNALVNTVQSAEPGSLFDGQSERAIIALLKEGSPASKEAALDLFRGRSIYHDYRPQVLRALAEAGLSEGYQRYLALLKQEARHIEREEVGIALSARLPDIADEIVNAFAPDDPEVEAIVEKHEEKLLDLYRALQQWLIEKIEECESGRH